MPKPCPLLSTAPWLIPSLGLVNSASAQEGSSGYPDVDDLLIEGEGEDGDGDAGDWADLVSESDPVDTSVDDLAELSLEHLMGLDVQVTSVSRKSENLRETSAAVHVITADQIRRAGARSIPEALRMAPGIRVTRLSSGRYAVTARGFTWDFADKVLVLVDGRSVYSPLFSGTEWENNDIPVEEVERIEVIRGPGGTMWGANAVNGVINIITKSAAADQEESLTVINGTEERHDVILRGGTKVSENGFLRSFARVNERDSLAPNSTGIDDGFEQLRFGMRGDFRLPEGADVMISAGAFDVSSPRGQALASTSPPYLIPVDSDAESSGGNFLGRWTKTHDSGAVSILQGSVAYLDTDSRYITQKRTQFDLFYQRESRPSESQTLVFGAAARYTDADLQDNEFFDWLGNRHDTLYSGFLQDQIELSDRLTFTVGAKLEDNPFTGFEFQPSVRGAYVLNDETMFWGAISRAIQTPNEALRGARVLFRVIPDMGSGFTTSLVTTPNDDDTPESVLAFEGGARTRLGERTTVDFAAFLNHYSDVHSVVLGDPFPTSGTTLEVPIVSRAAGDMTTVGFEISGTHVMAEHMVARASYSYIHVEEDYDENLNVLGWFFESATPKHIAHLGLSYDPAPDIELDLNTYFVSRQSRDTGSLGSSIRADFRVGWRAVDGVDLSVTAHGLFHDDEKEMVPDAGTDPYGVQQGAFLGLRFNF